jgi:hypothetical protein
LEVDGIKGRKETVQRYASVTAENYRAFTL